MLELLAKEHILWLKMVINMGCSKDVAEDIVQEMYLKLHRLIKEQDKIMYNDEEVNRFYVFVTLKNLYIDYRKAKNKYTFFEFIETDNESDEEADDAFLNEMNDIEKDVAFTNLINSITEEINSWHLYDAKLCNTYYKSNLSLRDISTGSKISLTSIFNSVKNYKKILRDKFEEDVLDFYNEDYHLINKKTNN
tara:strand:- start:1620 stop:2198 length:579 start_codon:yes stop_codon:yes gene_type:complete